MSLGIGTKSSVLEQDQHNDEGVDASQKDQHEADMFNDAINLITDECE